MVKEKGIINIDMEMGIHINNTINMYEDIKDKVKKPKTKEENEGFKSFSDIYNHKG